MEVSLTPLKRFEEYLQSRGMRNTDQRRALVEHIFSHHQHFDADQLIDQLADWMKPIEYSDSEANESQLVSI